MKDDEVLNALLDGEATPEERAALEARLAAEPDLRERLEALRTLDAGLRDAYAGAAAEAEEATARFRVPAEEPARRRVSLWLVPASLAAGLGAGLLLPGLLDGGGAAVVPPPPPVHAPPPVAAFIAQAPEGIRAEGRGTLASGQEVRAGDLLEVPADGKVSLFLRDGTEVRLDRGARVRVPGGRRLEVERGRVWSRVARGEPFLLGAGDARVTVLGTELSVSRGEERTDVLLFSGSARVEAGGETRELAAGQETRVTGGRLGKVARIDSEAMATGWMLELYAWSGRHDRDMAEHLDRLLAEMGRRKIHHLEEEAIIRDLGRACRVPLARFLVSEAAEGETTARRKAARVLVSIADASVAPDLARALRDPDGEVRVHAARALRVLSDGKACPEPRLFAERVDEAAAAAAEAWAREAAGPR